MEEWRSVPGWPNHEVSDHGRVKRLRYWNGRAWIEKEKILKPVPHHNGYVAVTLCDKGRQQVFLIHSLVLRAFVGEPQPGETARHFPDPDRSNNRRDNLSWAKKWVNEQDKTVQGMKQRRLTLEEINMAVEMRRNGASQTAIAAKLGVVQATISRLLSGHHWGELTGMRRN